MKYENGGELNCNLLTYMANNNRDPFDPCGESRFVDFIWDRWSTKKAVYLQLNYTGIDAGIVYYLRIGPGKSGKWEITLWRRQFQALPGAPRFPTTVRRITAVERVETEITSRWRLILKDSAGAKVLELPRRLEGYY